MLSSKWKQLMCMIIKNKCIQNNGGKRIYENNLITLEKEKVIYIDVIKIGCDKINKLWLLFTIILIIMINL